MAALRPKRPPYDQNSSNGKRVLTLPFRLAALGLDNRCVRNSGPVNALVIKPGARAGVQIATNLLENIGGFG